MEHAAAEASTGRRSTVDAASPSRTGRRRRRGPSALIAAAPALGLLAGCGCGVETPAASVEVHLDQEQALPSGAALTSATQSVNRYSSVLRGLGWVDLLAKDRSRRLALRLRGEGGGQALHTGAVDARFLVPLLPYAVPDGRPDAFDLANLMLAEYARNGVELSYQEANTRYGSFRADGGLFDGADGEEYFFEDGELRPNPRVRPKRLSVINNCLSPGLWELAAADSVGEMYHAWFTFPEPLYLDLVRRASGLTIGDRELAAALAYRADLGEVPLDLERLRRAVETLPPGEARLVTEKKLGGYSSQDSRRKVQRGFYEVLRGDRPVSVATLGDLVPGDRFSLRAFIPPGIYSAAERRMVDHDPDWRRVELRRVEPRTRYPGQQSTAAGELGHLEVWLHSGDGTRALVVGNLPIALLVVQDDYAIPALGAGVLEPSELIERRFLRLSEGPAPHYAYLVRREREGAPWHLLNNHEAGLEQVFLRALERDGEVHLRLTLVAYERIVDLLEFEVPLSGDLAGRVREASRAYRPSLYRVYRDDNVL